MRDPAGELSKGFHLLGLQELLLQSRALRNLQFEFGGPILHAMFKFDTRLLQYGIALLNLPQHRIKSVGEFAEFITGLLDGAHRIVSIFGDHTYGPRQLQNGIEDPPLKPRKYLEDDQG